MRAPFGLAPFVTDTHAVANSGSEPDGYSASRHAASVAHPDSDSRAPYPRAYAAPPQAG
jgi:hypothetical protein